MAVTVNASQLRIILRACLKARKNVLITGAPGIGKSEIADQATFDEAGAQDFDLILEHPAVGDPTDFKGLPADKPGTDEATFKPFGNFARALKATKPTVWFFDDLGQATAAVQAAAMQLLLARQVNGHRLPDCVTFIAATNRRGDRAGVTGILEPVKSRFATIIELEPTITEWCHWAIDKGVNPIGIAFLRFKPELLSAFQPTADLTNSPMPRTWKNLFDLEGLNLPAEIEAATFAGAVGEAAANEYLVFRSMYQKLVNVDAILADPDHADIPTKLDELYAVSTGLANRANVKNFARVLKYATRIHKEAKRGEFAVLIVRDAQRNAPEIIHTDAYIQMSCGPIGELINGSK